MTEPDATLERRRDIARTYDRLAAQITWLLGERGVDDAAVARAVLCTMRGEAVAEPFTTAGHRNVLGRLALLWLWRGPVVASLLVVSGPARLEQIAAGEGTIADAVAPLRALELGPAQEDGLLPRLRAILGDEEEAITDLWSLDGWALESRLKEMRQRLSSAEAREVLEAIADDVAGKVAEKVVEQSGPLVTAMDYIARARQSVGGAALDPARTRLAPVKLDVALADVEAALALEPENVDALLLRANIHALSGQNLDRAKDDIARVLERDPENGDAYTALAAILQQENNHGEAIEACTRAIRAGRPSVEARLYRGVMRVDSGDLDGAEEDAAIATAELPRAPAGYWVRGRVRALRGDSSGALDAYEIALALDPSHAATYSARADVFVAMGDHRRALADMDKAVALSGAGTLYYNRGTVKFAMGDYRGAGADFTAAIERDPLDLQAYLNRGAVSYFFGDHEATLRDFKRATEIAPTYAQARMKYGVMLYELGRKSEALVELRAALSCAPADWAPRAQIEGIVASIV